MNTGRILAKYTERGYELVIHPCSADNTDIIDELATTIECSQLAWLIISPPLSEIPDVLDATDDMNIPFMGIISISEDSQGSSYCVYINDPDVAFLFQHLVHLRSPKTSVDSIPHWYFRPQLVKRRSPLCVPVK